MFFLQLPSSMPGLDPHLQDWTTVATGSGTSARPISATRTSAAAATITTTAIPWAAQPC